MYSSGVLKPDLALMLPSIDATWSAWILHFDGQNSNIFYFYTDLSKRIQSDYNIVWCSQTNRI